MPIESPFLHATQLPFVPSWIPTWFVVANTGAVEAMLATAVWRCFVRKTTRRRAATFGLSLGILALVQALGWIEVTSSPACSCTDLCHALKYRVALWQGGPATPVYAVFRLREDRSRILGRVIARKVTVYLDDGSAGSLRGCAWPTGSTVLVEVSGGYAESSELLNDLWPYHAWNGRGFADTPEVWEAFCRSRAVAASPSLMAVATIESSSVPE